MEYNHYCIFDKTTAMLRYVIFFTLLFPFAVNAQQMDTIRKGDTTIIHHKSTNENEIFTYVNRIPKAKYNVERYISKNFKYPIEAINEEHPDRVPVQVIINQDGGIDSIRLLKKVHPSLEKEIKRVVSSMPKWEPAYHEGRYVRAPYTIQIHITPKD